MVEVTDHVRLVRKPGWSEWVKAVVDEIVCMVAREREFSPGATEALPGEAQRGRATEECMSTALDEPGEEGDPNWRGVSR